MWHFKESADNHNWSPGSLGAGYITAPTNTPDSFDLLQMDVRTWKIGPDQTQDIEREFIRQRPTTPILFQFYISPTGGVHDGGKGFKNRTGKPIEAVINYLHRLDNRLYNGHDEIKVNRLSNVEESPEPHFNPLTGEPCYCSMGGEQEEGLEPKEANIKYKDIKRGQLPEGIDEKVQNYLIRLVEGGSALNQNGEPIGQPTEPNPGMKKAIPWIVQQLKIGNLEYRPANILVQESLSITDKCMQDQPEGQRGGNRAFGYRAEELANLFNAPQSPARLNEDGTQVDLMQLDPVAIVKLMDKHTAWVKEREEKARIKAIEENQPVVYKFDEPEGWYVVKLNPSAEEVKLEGIIQGNCFQQWEMGYQKAAEEGMLDIYVLKDPRGRHHALWAYNPDGSIAVMESNSKMYSQEEGWRGYNVHDPEMRKLISKANEALGLSDEYEEWSREGEHFRQPRIIILPYVHNVDSYLTQYSDVLDFANAWIGPDYADKFEALIEEMADEQNIAMNGSPEVQKGEISWDPVVRDLFNGPMTGNNTAKQVPFNRFIKVVEANNHYEEFMNEAERFFNAPNPERNRNQDNLKAYGEWREQHINPLTDKIESPKVYSPESVHHMNAYQRYREQFRTNPWAMQLPEWEDFIAQTGGILPVSMDPKILENARVDQEQVQLTCSKCNGTGEIGGDYGEDKECHICNGTGITEYSAQGREVTIPSVEERERIRKERGLRRRPEPAAHISEDPRSGQLFFSKKKSWSMKPLSALQELKLHLTSFRPKKSHTLSWVAGGKGRGIMLYDGTLVTWPIDKKGNPQHADMYEYLTSEKLPPLPEPDHFTKGVAFDIYEDGSIEFFSENVPADLIADISKIDYRLKRGAERTSSVKYHGNDFHFNIYTGRPCDCIYGERKASLRRYASQAVRKIKNQKQKFLQNEEGTAILDYLHRLISGQGIDKPGEFGDGEHPGLEGMIPWIIRQIKLGEIQPRFDENGQIWSMGYLSLSDATRKIEFERTARYLQTPPVLLVGEFDPERVEATKKEYIHSIRAGKEVITTDADNPELETAVINAQDMSVDDLSNMVQEMLEKDYLRIQILGANKIFFDAIEANPDPLRIPVSEMPYNSFATLGKEIFLTGLKFNSDDVTEVWDRVRMSGGLDVMAAVNDAFNKSYHSIKDEDIDTSKVTLRMLMPNFFDVCPWQRWSDWFNAENSPARRSRNKDQINAAINRAKRSAEYLNERHDAGINTTSFSLTNEGLLRLIAEEFGLNYNSFRSIVRDCLQKANLSTVFDLDNEEFDQFVESMAKFFSGNISEMAPSRVDELSFAHVAYVKELEERQKAIDMFADIKEDTIVYRIEDPKYKGWTVNAIRDAEEAELEGSVMGHCIGSDEQKYKAAIDEGIIEAFSVRDKDGVPKLTFHFNPDGTLAHVQGKSLDAYGQFRHLVTEFNTETERDDDNGGSGSEQDLNNHEDLVWEFTLSDIDDMEGYITQLTDPHGLAREQADARGERLHHECEVNIGDIDWDKIADEFVELNLNSRGGRDLLRDFLKVMNFYGYSYHMGEFEKAVDEHLERFDYYEDEGYDYRYDDNVDFYKKWNSVNTNRSTFRMEPSRLFTSKRSYEVFLNRIEERYGSSIRNKMPSWKNLFDATSVFIANDEATVKYLPSAFNPDNWTDNPNLCQYCHGSQYVIEPRLINTRGETANTLVRCQWCQGQDPEERGNVQMPSAFEHPMEQISEEAPEIPQPETQSAKSYCPYCVGRGSVKVLVPIEGSDEEAYEQVQTRCKHCNGDGILTFTYEASTKAQFTKEDAYELLEKNNWNFNGNEFWMGMNDELEHTDVTHGDPEMTAKIVADHLREHPDYYTQLRTKISTNYHKFRFHFNPFSGKICHCEYGRARHPRWRTSSQAVRKIRNQNQKFLRNEEGQAILEFLHKLISGHSIEEKGEFGQGRYPGIEGMVPWIIKQIKTGMIRPHYGRNNEGQREIDGLHQFNGSQKDFEQSLKEIGMVEQSHPIFVYSAGSSFGGLKNRDPNDMIEESVKQNVEYGYKITSDPNTEGIRAAWINCVNLNYETLKNIIQSLPDLEGRIFLGNETSFETRINDAEIKQLKEEFNAQAALYSTPGDVIQKFGKNLDPDLSKVSPTKIPDYRFHPIPWNKWSEWFNARNAPTRKGKTKEQMEAALRRAIKAAEYQNERHDADISTDLNYDNEALLTLFAKELGLNLIIIYRELLNMDSDLSLDEKLQRLADRFSGNIDKMDPDQVTDLSTIHQNYLEEMEKREELKQMFADTKDEGVVYRIQDPRFKGWTVHEISNREEGERESQVLGHCIGDESQNYMAALDRGEIKIFSLRDEDGIPVLTFHFNEDDSLAHIQGKSKDSYYLYRPLISEFNKANNYDDDNGGEGHEDLLEPDGATYWQLRDVTNITEYVEQIHDTWDCAVYEANENNQTLADDCEIDRGGIHWSDVTDDFIEKASSGHNYHDDLVKDFLNTISSPHYSGSWVMKQFNESMQKAYNEIGNEEEYKSAFDLWHRWQAINQGKQLGGDFGFVTPREMTESDYLGFVRKVYDELGSEAADRMPKFEDLPTSVSGERATDDTHVRSYRYLPPVLDPFHQIEKGDACYHCQGVGHVLKEDGFAKCEYCEGSGKFFEVPEVQDIASMPIAENPMAQISEQAPEIPAQKTQTISNRCRRCYGAGRIIERGEDGTVMSILCPDCNGKGWHEFIYEASITAKEKAEAWDKPRIQLTAAQKAYVDGRLVEPTSSLWEF